VPSRSKGLLLLRRTRSRRSALVLLVLLAAALPSTALSGAPGTKRYARVAKCATLADPAPRLFAPSSVWNAPLAPDAALDPTSRALVTRLVAEVAREQRLGWGPWISSSSSSTPIYTVGRDQAPVKVQLDNPTLSWRTSLQAAFDAVPIPAAARPALGPDAHLTIWQPSTNKLWEFWKARKLADGWHASWGGAIAKVSQSPGYYTASSWPGATPSWGATATSLPVAAGTIRINELLRGCIDHALAVDLPYPRAGVISWPAQRSDGTGGPTEIPEGARLRLDPNLDLSRLDMPPLVRMMAVAAQKYGMIVRDQTHHAVGFFIEDPRPSRSLRLFYSANGSISPTGFYSGRYPTQLLASFPWRSLQVLRMDLRPAPKY
jgi:hypothetical protein